MYWRKMIPEFPRAPEKAAAAMEEAVSARDLETRVPSAMERQVKTMLSPVSPSGTGKTLMLLRCSLRRSRAAVPARKAFLYLSPSIHRIFIFKG
jgi:hypothetical protein